MCWIHRIRKQYVVCWIHNIRKQCVGYTGYANNMSCAGSKTYANNVLDTQNTQTICCVLDTQDTKTMCFRVIFNNGCPVVRQGDLSGRYMCVMNWCYLSISVTCCKTLRKLYSSDITVQRIGLIILSVEREKICFILTSNHFFNTNWLQSDQFVVIFPMQSSELTKSLNFGSS